MLKKQAHEFQTVKGHKLLFAVIPVILVGKGDHTGSRIKGLNPRSGNRRAVGIPRQIADHMRGRIQGLLQMDMKGETGKQLLEGRLQGEGRIQLRKKEAAEDFGKRLGREEEVLRGMNKGSPGSRQTASGNEYMEMRMKLKRLPPGMKNGGEAGRETEKTLGSGQGGNGLRSSGKERIQTEFRMAQEQRAELGGNGKDQVIIGNGKGLSMKGFRPGFLPGRLADRAVTIRTGMEEGRIGTAIRTGGKKAAHVWSAAGGDMVQDFDRLPGKVRKFEKVFFEKGEDLLYTVRQGDHLPPDPQGFLGKKSARWRD